MTKSHFVATILFCIQPLALASAPRIDWLCEGESAKGAHISFNLIMAEHDGTDYSYKMLENFLFNGQETTPINLNKTEVFCGWDADRNEIIGVQDWSLDGRSLRYVSTCPRGLFQFEATCVD